MTNDTRSVSKKLPEQSTWETAPVRECTYYTQMATSVVNEMPMPSLLEKLYKFDSNASVLMGN
jgi:hypothetical protein